MFVRLCRFENQLQVFVIGFLEINVDLSKAGVIREQLVAEILHVRLNHRRRGQRALSLLGQQPQRAATRVRVSVRALCSRFSPFSVTNSQLLPHALVRECNFGTDNMTPAVS
jgi:hypothetical protein